MKKSVSYIIIVIMALSFSMFTGCSKNNIDTVDTSLKVMSYNIRLFTEENKSANSWRNRKEELIELIKKSNPDLIGFQEITDFQYDFLKDNLAEYDFYGVKRSADPYGEYASVFYKKDRFEIIESSSFWLSETPEKMSIGWDASTYRICSYVKLKDKNSGRDFIISIRILTT